MTRLRVFRSWYFRPRSLLPALFARTVFGSWTVVTTPTPIQLQNAVTNPVVIGNTLVPPTTYSGIQVSFINPVYWIQNNTASSSLPARSMERSRAHLPREPAPSAESASRRICATSTVISGSPFPLTLNTGATGQGFVIDLNLSSMIQSDYSIFSNTTGVTGVTFGNAIGTNPAGNMANITTRGQITAVNITSTTLGTGTFTIGPMNYAATTNTLPQVITLVGNGSTTPTTLTGFNASARTQACTTLNTSCVPGSRPERAGELRNQSEYAQREWGDQHNSGD